MFWVKALTRYKQENEVEYRKYMPEILCHSSVVYGWGHDLHH